VELWEDEKGMETILPPKIQRKMKKKRYPDPDSNKTNVNYTKKTNEAHKKNLQEEMLQVINENFMEMLLNMVNQNVQEALKKL
jgi:hypothetical protein